MNKNFEYRVVEYLDGVWYQLELIRVKCKKDSAICVGGKFCTDLCSKFRGHEIEGESIRCAYKCNGGEQMDNQQREKLIEEVKNELHKESGLYEMKYGGDMYAIDLKRCKDKLAEKITDNILKQVESKLVSVVSELIDYLQKGLGDGRSMVSSEFIIERLNCTLFYTPSKWVSVVDKLPRKQARYMQLTLLLNGRTVTQGGFDDGKFWIDGNEVFNVTAYQYLPKPPNTNNEEYKC